MVAALPFPHLSPLLQRQLEFQQERLTHVQAQDPQKAPIDQEDQTGPKTSLTPLRLASGTTPCLRVT